MVEEKIVLKKGYIASDEPSNKKALKIMEEFKGEMQDPLVKFPKELGVEHPFDFETVEQVYKRVSFVSGAVNKYVDHIVGDFTIKTDNPNAEVILKDFVKNTNFANTLRGWIREGISKGNGFMELDLKEQKIRVLNANNMFVKRTTKGKVLGYNQFLGNKNKFTALSKVIEFAPDKIAHLKINDIAEAAYGLGMIWTNERAIEDLVNNLLDKSKLISRKAGAPMHVQVGVEGESVNPADIEDFKTKLQYMNNRTEWVTDANVKISVLDFKDLGKNLEEGIRTSVLMLLAGFEVPEVLMGSGQLNEGIARVQLESWQRKIKAIQEQIESIIEEKIFKPILNENGFDEHVEFVWNLPGEEEINNRIQKISELIKTPFISNKMRAGLELELARIMNLPEVEAVLISPGMAKEDTDEDDEDSVEKEQEETLIPQPEVPGVKPNANQTQEKKHKKKFKSHAEMTIKEFVNLQEIEGFNYSDYLVRILQRVNIDPFTFLRGISEQDIIDGLFDSTEIERLRIVLKEGFRKNKTIQEIENDLSANITLKDRVVGGTVVVSAEARSLMITRTETVRLANMGLVDLYKQNNITEVRFLAALSDRTCPICEALNGQVFQIKELQQGSNQPPIHANCRCSLVSVVR